MSVVSVLLLVAREGAGPELERAFTELEIFEHSRRSGGFVAGRLLRPLQEGEPYVVVAEWEDAAAYRRWLDDPVRDELGPRLAPLLAHAVQAGSLYEEVR